MHNFSPKVFSLTRSFLTRLFRDKSAMFFTFLFPLMFLLIFGSLNRSTDGISFDVALLNKASSPFATQFVDQLKQIDVLKVDESISSFDDAKEKLAQGQIDSILELPETFGSATETGLPSGELTVYYEEADPQAGQTVATVMKGVIEEVNKTITQVTPPLSVITKATATSGLSSFDYVFSGLIGFSMLSLGIFGMANSLPVYKKSGALRRLRVAPITPAHLIVAQAITYLVIGLISIGIMVATAIIAFDFTLKGDYISFILFSIFGIIMMFGFGLAIGGWAQNENQSAPLSNLVSFPMMFLSGVFFPRFLMPEWLQGITQYLPLSPVVDGLRAITAEGATIFSLGPELLIIAIWTLVIYFVAIKLFRWE